MKRLVKPTRMRRAKRDLFAELVEGMEALADARHGKRTLKNLCDRIQARAHAHGNNWVLFARA